MKTCQDPVGDDTTVRMMTVVRKMADVAERGDIGQYSRCSRSWFKYATCVPSRLRDTLMFVFMQTIEGVFWRNNQSEDNRRWSGHISGEWCSDNLSCGSGRSDDLYNRKLEALRNQRVLYCFRFGSPRLPYGVIRSFSYEKNLFQFGYALDDGSLTEDTERLPERSPVVMPISAIRIAVSLHSAVSAMLKVIRSRIPAKDYYASEGDLFEQISGRFCSDFLNGDVLAGMPQQIRKTVQPYSRDIHGTGSEYVFDYLVPHLSRFEPYAGYRITEKSLRDARIPPDLKSNLLMLFGSLSGSDCETGLPKSVVLGMSFRPHKSYVQSDDQVHKSYVQSDDQVHKSYVQSTGHADASYYEQACYKDGVAGITNSPETNELSDRNDLVRREQAEAVLDGVPDSETEEHNDMEEQHVLDVVTGDCQVATQHRTSENQMSRDFATRRDFEESCRKSPLLVCQKPKKVSRKPEEQVKLERMANLRDKPREYPPLKSGGGMLRHFIASAKEVFPNATVPHEKDSRELDAAQAVIETLAVAKCKNMLTANAWISWYLSSMKEDEACRFGVKMRKMLGTWRSFARYRPKPENALVRTVKVDPDMIWNSMSSQVGPSSENAGERMAMVAMIYGVFALAAYLEVLYGSAAVAHDNVSVMLRFVRRRADWAKFTARIYAATARYEAGLGGYPKGFAMSDWRTALADVWREAGCDHNAKHPPLPPEAVSGMESFMRRVNDEREE